MITPRFRCLFPKHFFVVFLVLMFVFADFLPAFAGNAPSTAPQAASSKTPAAVPGQTIAAKPVQAKTPAGPSTPAASPTAGKTPASPPSPTATPLPGKLPAAGPATNSEPGIPGILKEITLDVASIDGQQLDPGKAFWATSEKKFYLITESTETEAFAKHLNKPAKAVLKQLPAEVKGDMPASIREFEILDLKPLSGKDGEAVRADDEAAKAVQTAAIKQLSADMSSFMKTVMNDMLNDEASMPVDEGEGLDEAIESASSTAAP